MVDCLALEVLQSKAVILLKDVPLVSARDGFIAGITKLIFVSCVTQKIRLDDCKGPLWLLDL